MTQKDFQQKWIKLIKDEKLKVFPDDFVESIPTKEISLPNKNLILGPELFGSFELLDVGGNLIFNASSFTEAKFVLYANRYKPSKINLPLDDNDTAKIVKQYELHLDTILKEVEKEFKLEFPESTRFLEVSNHIFQALNIQRF
jgi:hypothetical protein